MRKPIIKIHLKRSDFNIIHVYTGDETIKKLFRVNQI